ncbi:MipA/OmpV family protein [Marinivivus vitaminiproducens]|uniref:MipA/OmpV family protein n=1 Tax=Marinivivus vitaminiproducens TaxID=3035935 RepID=UPI0027A1BB6E|nr:MipA/OmpV family protein [Geminicoccaceae bacterium SCSIO 64248]
MPAQNALRLVAAPALVAMVAAAGPASAQESPDRDEWRFEIGAGGALTPDYEGSSDYELRPLPYLSAERGPYWVSLNGLTARANLVPSEVFTAGPVVRYRGKRGSVQNDAVDDLSNVDPAVEIGAFGRMNLNGFLLEGSATQDVADGHDGLLASVGTGFGYEFTDSLAGSAIISTTYASGNYMSSYFGVDAGDAARSGLDEYDADGGFKDVGLRLNARYDFSTSLAVTATAAYTRLVGDAADSPIVDDEGSENQVLGLLTLIYAF